MRRSLELTSERLTAYSRSGNFHSDPDAAAALGYAGMVAQGMQVAGPAYALLLDAWGEGFLQHGEIELTFVGVVTDGQTISVDFEPSPADAAFEVTEGGRAVVVGRASRTAQRARGGAGSAVEGDAYH